MSKYNKALIRDNIKFLAGNKGIKIGEVETQAGVSVGYLSRIVNDNNTSNALLDVIMTFAEKMGVTIDSLLNVNFSVLSPEEKYLADFFHNLIFKTRDHLISWTAETQDKLKKYDPAEDHPLIIIDSYGYSHFQSLFRRDDQIINAIYHTVINEVTIYLLKAADFNNSNLCFYDLYFYQTKEKNLNPLCEVGIDNKLFSIVSELYMTAEMSSTSIHITEQSKKIIDGIMSLKTENENTQTKNEQKHNLKTKPLIDFNTEFSLRKTKKTNNKNMLF